MRPDDRDQETVREFRLEGFGLALVAVAAVVALAVAFWFGMLYERRYGGAESAAGTEYTAGEEGAETADFEEVTAEEGLTFFDTVEGEGKQAEPQREARADAAPDRPVSPPAEKQAAPAAPGPFFVQVFAGRDRTSAERLVTRLADGGYPVRMHTLREAQSSLYKVLVGGYPSRDEAVPVVDALKKDGFEGAWITEMKSP